MRANGFSLVECLIAMAIVMTGVASLAQLAAAATQATRAAAARSVAILLAVDKIEQLQPLPWSALTPSPLSALDENNDGYVDRPSGWTRRWSIQPLPAGPSDTMVIQVRVIGPHGEEARLTTVSARRGN